MGAIWGPVLGGTGWTPRPEGSLHMCCPAFVFKAFNSVGHVLFKGWEELSGTLWLREYEQVLC